MHILRKHFKKGFTLVELVVVIAIIGILGSVSVVGYMGFVDKANQSVVETEANTFKDIILTGQLDSASNFTYEVKGGVSGLKTTYKGALNTDLKVLVNYFEKMSNTTIDPTLISLKEVNDISGDATGVNETDNFIAFMEYRNIHTDKFVIVSFSR